MQHKLTPRHIKLLSKHLSDKNINFELEIAEWVKQNPEYNGPSVGLNLTQVDQLWDYIVQHSNIDRYVNQSELTGLINKFQETIDFDGHPNNDLKPEHDTHLAMEQCVIGLNETQIFELSDSLYSLYGFQCQDDICEYLKTQSFWTTKFTPNWDLISKNVKTLTILYRWADCDGYIVEDECVAQYNRPTRKIEIGSKWQLSHDAAAQCIVLGVGHDDVAIQWIDSNELNISLISEFGDTFVEVLK